MNKAGIRWLYQELPELVQNGVLSQDCADKLQQHYGPVRTTGKTTAMLVILGTLGSLLIGLGIILLLAHNWEQFSRFTRMILSLLPLVLGQGLCLWVMQKKPDSGAFKEGAATFLSLMVGAAISLIGQTYNIPADSGSFTLTWMLLIIPLTYLMQATLPAVFYLIGITVWTGINFDSLLNVFWFWPLAAVTLPHFLWAIRRESYALRGAIFSFIAVICISFGASFSLGKFWPSAWMFIFSGLYSIFYSLGCVKAGGLTANWQKPLRLLGGIALFILAYIFTFRNVWVYGLGANPEISGTGFLLDQTIIIAIVTGAVLLFFGNIRNRNQIASLFSVVPLLVFIAYLVSARSPVLALLIFNAYLLVLSISHIRLGIRNANLGLTNIGMLMLAVLIIARFFDSDIGFVAKGLVFIILGIGFLTVNLQLSRRLRGAK